MSWRNRSVWRLNSLQRMGDKLFQLVCFVVLSVGAFVYALYMLNSSSLRGFPADVGLPRRQATAVRSADAGDAPPDHQLPTVTYTCPHDTHKEAPQAQLFGRATEANTDNVILVWLDSVYSDASKQIVNMLDGLKFSYQVEVFSGQLPELTTGADGRGRFSLIIIENYYRYINMDDWNRQIVDKYCVQFGVGVLGLLGPRSDKTYRRARVKGHRLDVLQRRLVTSAGWPANCTMCHTARQGATFRHESLRAHNWLLFDWQDESRSYESVITAHYVADDDAGGSESTGSLVVLDKGLADGVPRVLFGCSLAFWMAAVSFIDAIRYLTGGRLSMPLTRYVQIDIDDIFVGATGTRMREADVQELIARQRIFRERYVDDFRFSLGFSGKYFRSGNDDEKRADELLIESADEFVWFPHMWRHQQAHQWNSSQLMRLALLNQQFAQNYHLPVTTQYAVAPHHSGVYPVHEPLYDMWTRVWHVNVTSTEEYPHLKPDTRRRGFVHRGIQVLPRQTCGLFTHNLRLHAYPGGSRKLLGSVFGGELFFTFLLNPFLIFMTHWQNYGHDRLALFTFESEFRFLRCWTNVQLRWTPPGRMADMYFERWPAERAPVWTNPCLDKRHMQIWSGDPTCSQLPSFLILGPQKTGTTALHSFLSAHPQLRPSQPSPQTFEEVQFFGSKNYLNGIQWYMDFFRPPASEGLLPAEPKERPDVDDDEDDDDDYDDMNRPKDFDRPKRTADRDDSARELDDVDEWLYFDKSATYFDSPLAPGQVRALLPDARLLVLLIDPADRAHSWYQHARAKQQQSALEHTFTQVLAADTSSSNKQVSRQLRSLRRRCVEPGLYAEHLTRWLAHFPAKQLYVVDGDRLKTHPADVLQQLQLFLQPPQIIDYSQILRWSSSKGFYCVQRAGASKPVCLGSGKGRQYPPMSAGERASLNTLYAGHNQALHRLLTANGWTQPAWLLRALNHTAQTHGA